MLLNLQVMCVLLTEVLLCFASPTDDPSTSWATEIRTKRKAEVVETPKFAGCEPELRTVSLRQSDDYSIVYSPSCTRIERCGGCCVKSSHECTPLEKVNVTYRIKMTKYRERSQSIEIQVEKHTKCGCQCIRKPTDCNIRQTFITRNCICRCANTEEKQKCEADGAIKLWDNDQCVCKCRNVENCQPNTIFNNFSCRCEEERLPLWRT